jgi:predicted metal-dependent HD superfamily phosphohydrolase
MEDELPSRWEQLCRDLGLRGATDVLGAELLAAYASPARHYHGVRHLDAVLRGLDELWPHPDRPVPGFTRAAAWFHDAVYEPARSDNEAASATWARRALRACGAEEPVTLLSARLVEATAAHRLDGGLFLRAGAACFLDADLAVLGTDAATYGAYADGIRAEYRHLDADAFRRGRAAVLSGLAARPFLFLSARGRARHEVRARRNLGRELAALGAAVSAGAAAGRPGGGA